MATALVPEPTSVTVVDGCVVLDHFYELDDAVVDVVGQEHDPAAAVHRCLQIGARAIVSAHTALEAGVVERAFSELNDSLATRLDEALGHMDGIAGALVDDQHGALPALLRHLQQELASQLGALFDPGSKTSALSRLEEVFARSSGTHSRAMGALLDPDDPMSPLGRWKAEVLATVRDNSAAVVRQVQELSTAVAVERARAEVFAITTAKGFSFEEVVHGALDRLSAHHGDLAEPVGRSSGAAARRTGDELVTINPDDTGGARAAIVVEVKNRRLTRRSLLNELDRAMENREAQAAVAVVAQIDQAPGGLPLQLFANKAIVALDDHLLADRALELAYVWARSVARRSLAHRPDEIDMEEIHARLADACGALGRVSNVRRHLSAARKGIEGGQVEVDCLVAELDSALRRLRGAIEGVAAGDGSPLDGR